MKRCLPQLVLLTAVGVLALQGCADQIDTKPMASESTSSGVNERAVASSPNSGEEAKSPPKISVDEIGKSIILVGRLGVPLGKKMKISGYWHFPSGLEKDVSIRFTVTTVNEQKLAVPVEFNHKQLEFMDSEHKDVIPAFESHRELEGQEWALTAYENGEIRISPDEYGEKMPLSRIAAEAYYTRPFTSRIVGVLQRKTGRSIR